MLLLTIKVTVMQMLNIYIDVFLYTHIYIDIYAHTHPHTRTPSAGENLLVHLAVQPLVASMK